MAQRETESGSTRENLCQGQSPKGGPAKAVRTDGDAVPCAGGAAQALALALLAAAELARLSHGTCRGKTAGDGCGSEAAPAQAVDAPRARPGGAPARAVERPPEAAAAAPRAPAPAVDAPADDEDDAPAHLLEGLEGQQHPTQEQPPQPQTKTEFMHFMNEMDADTRDPYRSEHARGFVRERYVLRPRD